MKKVKYVIYILALCFYSYIFLPMTKGTDLIHLYQGVRFNSNISAYVMQFFLFLCYSLFIYNEFETYIEEYGILIMTRVQSRNKLINQLTKKMFGLVIQIELIKIVCYTIISIFRNGTITVNSPNELLRIVVLEVLVYTIILFVQMILEIYYSGKIALCINLTYFIACINLGDMLYGITNNVKWLNFFILPNLMMKCRLDLLVDKKETYYWIFIVLGITVLSIYFIVRRIFSKKDIIGSN